MQARKIAVLGGGNGAHIMAADMAAKGHIVNMYNMPQYKHELQPVFGSGGVWVEGAIKDLNGFHKMNMVTDDIDKAVDGVEIILLVTPAFAHEDYAKLLISYLHDLAPEQVEITRAMRAEIRNQFKSVAITEEDYYDTAAGSAPAPSIPAGPPEAAPDDGFINIPEGIDAELPFK